MTLSDNNEGQSDTERPSSSTESHSTHDTAAETQPSSYASPSLAPETEPTNSAPPLPGPPTEPQASVESGAPPDDSGNLSETVSTQKRNAELIKRKLDQIQNYIQQTSNAIDAIEQSGKTNTDQYQTLLKVLQDLKGSQKKLNEQLEIENKKDTESKEVEPGSERVGVVGSMNEPVNPMSMRERLARQEIEQNLLSTRLRESVAKRQELIARYENTRERLNALKQQRRNLVQEERQILVSQGAPDNAYDDSLPDAETWSIEDLEKGIEEFQGLRDKVVHLRTLYQAQVNAGSPDDTDLRERIAQKLTQVNSKEEQVNSILRQLESVLEKKREGVENEVTGASGETETVEESTPKDDLDESLQGAVGGSNEPDRRSVPQISDGKYVTTSGVVVELSEMEKTNPTITSTFESLIQMKQKLATLENLSDVLSNAQKTPGAITNILAQHNLSDLLRDTDTSESQYPDTTTGNDSPPRIGISSPINTNAMLNHQMTPQRRIFHKNNSPINVVNDFPDARDRSVTRPNRPNIWTSLESHSREGTSDAMTQMNRLQEEIRQKKNAMESLRKSMGKSSTFVPDMTDNISENVSDHVSESNRNRRISNDPAIDPPGACSIDYYTQSNDPWSTPAQPRCRPMRPDMHKNSFNEQMSINNLEPHDCYSSHAKQNTGMRYMNSNNDNGWPSRSDNVHPQEYTNLKSKISEAANEISTLKDTMQQLRSLLPQGYNAPQSTHLVNNMMYPPNNNVQRQHPSMMMQSNQGSLDTKMLYQLNHSVQKCLDIIELHSLEILTLNKQLQVRYPPTQYPTFCPPHFPPPGPYR